MKRFFIRYSHWLSLLVISFSFSTLFINFSYSKPEVIALLFGGVGLISVAFLVFITEKQIRKKGNEK